MTEKKKTIPKLLIRTTHGFGEAESGRLSCIEVEDEQGVRVAIMIPHKLEGEFLARFQGACLHSAKARGGRTQDQIERLLETESVGVGVTDDRKIGLRLKLAIGMTLDVVLSDKAIAEFRDALAELERYRKAGGSGSSH
jgi:hypothetical protein